MVSRAISFGKDLKNEVKEDRATGLAAEQAYYYMLSLFPLLILLLSILPYMQIEQKQALDFMNHFIPSESSQILEDTIIKIISERNGGLLTFGILGTIWSASNGMNAFIHSMNAAFDVEETRGFIKARLLSIVLTLGMIAAFIVVLVLPVFGKIILELINEVVPLSSAFETMVNILRWIIALAVLAVFLTCLYRFAPNKKYPFKQVLPGALAATAIWLALSLGFSFYVSNFANYSATYGSLGGVIILMLWLYFTGLTLVIGGEINALFHKRFLSMQPAERTTPKPTGSKGRSVTN